MRSSDANALAVTVAGRNASHSTSVPSRTREGALEGGDLRTVDEAAAPENGRPGLVERVAERCVHTVKVEERDGGRNGALRVNSPVRVAIAHEEAFTPRVAVDRLSTGATFPAL